MFAGATSIARASHCAPFFGADEGRRAVQKKQARRTLVWGASIRFAETTTVPLYESSQQQLQVQDASNRGRRDAHRHRSEAGEFRAM